MRLLRIGKEFINLDQMKWARFVSKSDPDNSTHSPGRQDGEDLLEIYFSSEEGENALIMPVVGTESVATVLALLKKYVVVEID